MAGSSKFPKSFEARCACFGGFSLPERGVAWFEFLVIRLQARLKMDEGKCVPYIFIPSFKVKQEFTWEDRVRLVERISKLPLIP